MTEKPTPRTKKAILAAQHLHCRGSFPVVYADRMAELECELTIANDKIARLMKCVEVADVYYEAIKIISGVYEQEDYYNARKEVDEAMGENTR